MKIWVLNPPYFKNFSRPQRSPAVTKSGTIYFPIWLASCTGVLENDGFDVTLTDAPARGMDIQTVCTMARDLSPGLVVVDTSTPSIDNDLEVCTKIRQVLPGVFIVLVGTHVSALADETLSRCDAVDAVARREYEFTILELTKTLEEKGGGREQAPDLSSIQGLSYRSRKDTGEAGIVHNPDRPFIENLDDLPWVSAVYKKHLCISDYFNPNARFPMVTLMTSRGCPFRCRFCVYPQTLTGRKFRFRSVENVVEELKYVKQAFPDLKSVFFEDDTLSASRKRCEALARAMIKEKINLPWTTNSRVDPDYDTLVMMKKAGCKSLCVGFESGEQKTLNTMSKGITKKKMFRFMDDAKRAGILIHGCFMVGFPGETRAQINKTVQLAKDLKPDTVQFYPVMVYPGTEAYEDYRAKGWLTARTFENWLTPEGLHNCVVRNETLSSDQLVEICNDARRQFYLRPSYIAYKLGQLVIRPTEIVRTLKAFRTFFRHLLRR